MDFLQDMCCDGQSDARGDPFSILILLIPACTRFRMGKEECFLWSGRPSDICVLRSADKLSATNT